MSVAVRRPPRLRKSVFRFCCNDCDWVGGATSWFEAGMREYNEHWHHTHRTVFIDCRTAPSRGPYPED